MARFFIDRPIFAGVISVIITLIGVFSLQFLPLAQYPEIAPPTVAVTAVFPGASAETMAETVAAPIEQEINGVEGMLYMSSSNTADGLTAITVTFRPGTDLNAAQVLVQNRVKLAEQRLPAETRQIGVTVEKQSTNFLLIASLTSPDKSLDIDYLGNYAQSILRDRLLRVPGVGTVQVFGGGNYSMRVWIDPDRAAARNLTAAEIVAALQAQNVQVAGGALGRQPAGDAPPAFDAPLQVEGRLQTPEQFADAVIKTDSDGRTTRVRDVARVELGQQDYSLRGYFDGVRGVAIAVIQQPGSNALSTADAVLKELKDASAQFPKGMEYTIPYNPTEYVAQSVDAVEHTLLEAIALVVLVVLVFLQTWRAAVIPIVAIPVALVGVFTIQLALGFSLNSLSLFALVLAVGIVVDDAIVVVESVERYIRMGVSPREAAYKTMHDVAGPLIAIGAVLISVFVPTAFTPGIPGAFYREFAVAISAASVISLIVSLTLSPALAALLLKPHSAQKPIGEFAAWRRPIVQTGRAFNKGFDTISNRYGRLTAKLVRMATMMLVVYAGLILLTGWRLAATPTGFIPEQDQGYLIGVIQLPPGASLDRTDAALQQVIELTDKTPGVDGSVAFAGLDGASFSSASNSAVLFVRLSTFEKRHGNPKLSALAISQELIGKAFAVSDASVFFIAPPAVPGLGQGGGFKMMIQDRTGQGYRALEGATGAMMGAAYTDDTAKKSVMQVFSLYNTGSPRVALDLDRNKAQLLGVSPSDVYQTLGIYLGSRYINDFNMQGRTYRVTAQAEASARRDVGDVANMKVRANTGAMVPIGSIATLRNDTGPVRVVRYNLFPASELQGSAAPGVSTGQALKVMEGLAAKALPDGFSYEWTDLALQEKLAGNSGVFIFLAAVVFVFLVLAALYESLTLPLAVILIVPMCVLAAILGVNLRGQDNNILTQIGFIVLIALAAKNAILIVAFAKQAEDERGVEPHAAAVEAAGTRLRPILMTSFAFIFGVLPLAIASGAGSEMRQALGTAVFFGMIGVTAFGLIFTPVFYVISRWIASKFPDLRARRAPRTIPDASPAPEARHE